MRTGLESWLIPVGTRLINSIDWVPAAQITDYFPAEFRNNLKLRQFVEKLSTSLLCEGCCTWKNEMMKNEMMKNEKCSRLAISLLQACCKAVSSLWRICFKAAASLLQTCCKLSKVNVTWIPYIIHRCITIMFIVYSNCSNL